MCVLLSYIQPKGLSTERKKYLEIKEKFSVPKPGTKGGTH